MSAVFGISLGEIVQVIEKLYKHSHNDENALCFNLDIINASLQNWYNDIIAKFSPWVANEKVDSSDLAIIYKYSKDSTRKDIAEKSLGFLREVERLYKSRELKKSIKDRLDIDKIEQAKNALEDFYNQTYLEKNMWMDAAFHKRPVERDHIIGWHDALDKDRKIVNESLSSVKRALKCQPMSKEQLQNYGL